MCGKGVDLRLFPRSNPSHMIFILHLHTWDPNMVYNDSRKFRSNRMNSF